MFAVALPHLGFGQLACHTVLTFAWLGFDIIDFFVCPRFVAAWMTTLFMDEVVAELAYIIWVEGHTYIVIC